MCAYNGVPAGIKYCNIAEGGLEGVSGHWAAIDAVDKAHKSMYSLFEARGELTCPIVVKRLRLLRRGPYSRVRMRKAIDLLHFPATRAFASVLRYGRGMFTTETLRALCATAASEARSFNDLGAR